jgi:hypothetical protein
MSGEQDFPASSRPSEDPAPGERSGEDSPGGDFSSDSVLSDSGGGGAPATAPAEREAPSRKDTPNMLPGRRRRRLGVERVLVRLIATCGIIGIGVAIAAIMVSSHSQGWLIGLVVSIVTVVLSAILWSSRQL